MDFERTVERFEKHNERQIGSFGYASGPEGRAIIKQYIDPVIGFIAQVREECPPPRKRPQMSLTPELWRAMEGVPDDVMAWAVFRGALNAIWTRKPDPSAALKARITIGWEIWRQSRAVAIHRADKKVAAKISKAVVRKGNIQAREIEERKQLRKHSIDFPRWGPELLALAGNWGYDCLLRALPEVFPETSDGVPAIDADVVDEAAAFVRELMLAHPAYSPSLEPPPPWVDFKDAYGTPFVRNAREETAIRLAMASGQMQAHVAAANYLQSVAWMINEPVLDFVKELAKCPDGRKLLKKVKRKGGWAVFALDMGMATSLIGRRFWIPQNIDFRGRLNPLPHFSYARPDHIRGLFKFAHGEVIGEDGIRWLKIAAANAFNENKLITRSPVSKRLAWTAENLDGILDVARDPMARLLWLRLAADPVQFVAIAKELKNALDVGPDYVTTLPIGFDASCSGAQHYSLLARDAHGARLTNLAPVQPETVECIYEAVRKRIAVQIAKDDVAAIEAAATGRWMECGFDYADGRYASWWNERGHIDRSLLKILVMTYFYGSEEGGLRLSIYDELFDRDFAVEEIPKGAVNYLIHAMQKAIQAELKGGAPVIMRYLRDIADTLGEEGKAAEWISPTGLPVVNLYRRALTKVPQLWLGDKTPRYTTAIAYGEFNEKKAKNAIAPNLVHTLDAAHLVQVANACAKLGVGLVCVHDSFAVLAPHATRLHEILREELVRLYETSDLLTQVREKAARALGTDENLSPVPPPGDLDRKKVLSASYAFS
jgi:Autographiviridae RNA polymerase